VRQRAARHHEQFEHVVEGCRVAAPLPDDRQQFAQVVAEHRRLQQALAGLHPVDVAAQGVYLAVVRDEAVGMRERPGGKSVRAEPLVHERERRLHVGVAQIREGRLNLRGGEHALVDERARRQARDVEPLSLRGGQRIDRVLDPLANDVQLAFERERIGVGRLAERRRCGDEDLLDDRPRRRGRGAEVAVLHRHRAPPEQCLPLVRHDALEHLANLLARGAVGGQEHRARPVRAGVGQRQPGRGRRLAQEAVRHLDQNARAVSGVRFTPAGAAVLQIDQDLETSRDDGMGAPACDVYDEPDATRIVFVGGIIQTDALGRVLVSCGHAPVMADVP